MDAYLIIGAAVLTAAVALVVGFELAQVLQRSHVPTVVEEPRPERQRVFKGHARELPTAGPGPRARRPRDDRRDATG